MKRVILTCLLAISISGFAQTLPAKSNSGLAEISSTAQLKRLSNQPKGSGIFELYIDYPLEAADFPYLKKILANQKLTDLSLIFKERPSQDLLNTIKNLSTLEVRMENAANLNALEQLDWASIDYVSLELHTTSDLFLLPIEDITAKYMELSASNDNNTIHFEFEKDSLHQDVYLSAQFLEEDSDQVVSYLQSKLGTLSGISVEGSQSLEGITLSDPKKRYDDKAEFFSIQNVPQDSWTLRANEATVVRSAEGAYICVPKDAFVTQSGNAYRGFVDLTYRQWNSTADMLNSQLPLYDAKDNGDTVFYITNGMFELRAYDANNDELLLAPNKSIGVQFPTITATDSFNLYSYNETTAQWDEKGTVEENKTDVFDNLSQLPLSNATTTLITDTANRSNSQLPAMSLDFDTTRFINRYTDLTYTNLIDDKKTQGRIPFYQHMHINKYWVAEKQYNGRNIIRPRIETIQMNDTLRFYKLSFNDRFYQRYPEAMAFRNRMWIPIDVGRKEFKKDFFKYKVYNDVSFQYLGGPHFVVELKSASGYQQVEIQPFYPHFGKQTSTKLARRLVRRYNKQYQLKQNIFDANITRDVSNFIRYRDTVFANLMRSYNDVTLQGRNPYILYARLNILTLGLSNIDHPYTMPQKTQVNPRYIASDQRIKNIDHVQIMDKATAGIFQFSGSAFIYSKKNVTQVIITDQEGKQYIATTASIQELKKYHGGYLTIEVEPFDVNKQQGMGWVNGEK